MRLLRGLCRVNHKWRGCEVGEQGIVSILILFVIAWIYIKERELENEKLNLIKEITESLAEVKEEQAND